MWSSVLGITIFKIFSWVGISFEILFYSKIMSGCI